MTHTIKIKELEDLLDERIRHGLPSPAPLGSTLFLIPIYSRIKAELTKNWKLLLRRGKWHMLSDTEEITKLLKLMKASPEQSEWMWKNLPIKKNKKNFTWKKSPWKKTDDIGTILNRLIEKRWKKTMEDGWKGFEYDLGDVGEEWIEYLDKNDILDLPIEDHLILNSDIITLKEANMGLEEFIAYTFKDKKETKSKPKQRTIYQTVNRRNQSDKSKFVNQAKVIMMTRQDAIDCIYAKYNNSSIEKETVEDYFTRVQEELTEASNSTWHMERRELYEEKQRQHVDTLIQQGLMEIEEDDK